MMIKIVYDEESTQTKSAFQVEDVVLYIVKLHRTLYNEHKNISAGAES